MTSKFKFKRGDTFDVSGPVAVGENETALTDLTGWQASSQVRSVPNNELIADLQLEWLQFSPPLLRLRATSTSSWPIGRAQIDIEFTSPAGDKVSTDTQSFEVVQDVTQ